MEENGYMKHITTKYYTIIEKFVPEQLTAYGRPSSPL